MKRVVTSANDKADLANANRRNFLRQVGTGAGMLAAGIVLNATTSATTLEAAQRHPELAKEIVAHGHEASGHGPRWSSQYAMTREEERQFLIAARDMVEAASGQRPVGYNCNWLRRSPNTLSLLQELGYL